MNKREVCLTSTGNIKSADEKGTNKQKGKKICTCCHKEKSLVNGFYISHSPLFSIDKRLPVCKDCIADMCLNSETGEIDEIELNKCLMKFDKPYYKDSLYSAYEQFKKEHSFLKDDEIKYHGKEIMSLYFKNISMRQTIDKSYDDSEKDGFIYKNSNTSISKKNKIASIFSDVNKTYEKENENIKQQEFVVNDDKEWTDKDKQNMNYSISVIGYDPFKGVNLTDSDRKYCFNILSSYCDTEGISDDGHKLQAVIEMTMMYCQCKKITESMNYELAKLDNMDDQKLAKLTTSKKSLLDAIATLAKDNNIASNYNKNSKQGQNTLTSKMKEIASNGIEEIKVNLFNIDTSESMKQIADLSNKSIMEQLTFDTNDYTEMVKEQREMLEKLQDENEKLSEENRTMKNTLSENGLV